MPGAELQLETWFPHCGRTRKLLVKLDESTKAKGSHQVVFLEEKSLLVSSCQ